MRYPNLSAEDRAKRWMDQRQIQNLMGRFVYDCMLKRELGIYDRFWCRTTPEPSLGVNSGFYVGEEAIREYYEAQYRNTEARTRVMVELFPDFLSRYSELERHGVGSLDIDALCTPVVEVADDGQTAKGMWNVMGIENDIFPNGPYSVLGYGYICGDFALEDGEWRIWHLCQLDELISPVGMDWSRAWEMPEPEGAFAALKGLTLPEPNVKRGLYRSYSGDREPVPQLMIPQPYATFSETFTYGAGQ